MATTILHRALRRVGGLELLPTGLRYRVLRALVPPDRQPPRPFVVSFFGRRYRGDLARYIDWMVFFFGAHEPHVLAFLDAVARVTPNRSVFLDIGANVGHHALFMAARAGTVHAFEPFPPLVSMIEEKIVDNALVNVVVHRVALGAQDARRSFRAPTRANVGIGTFLADAGDGTQREVGALPIVRGDRYLAEAGISGIGLAKIDVEGFEPYVLQGLRDTLLRDRPVIAMEWSETTAREFAIVGVPPTALLPPDYRILAIAPRGGRGYRLEPVAAELPVGDLALIPDEMAGAIAREGAIEG